MTDNPLDDLSPDVAAFLQDRRPPATSHSKKSETARQQTASHNSTSTTKKKRNKLRIDVPRWIENIVREIATQEDLSLSSAATFLLLEGIRAYRAGAHPSKKLCRHPRWKYVLDISEDNLREE